MAQLKVFILSQPSLLKPYKLQLHQLFVFWVCKIINRCFILWFTPSLFKTCPEIVILYYFRLTFDDLIDVNLSLIDLCKNLAPNQIYWPQVFCIVTINILSSFLVIIIMSTGKMHIWSVHSFLYHFYFLVACLNLWKLYTMKGPVLSMVDCKEPKTRDNGQHVAPPYPSMVPWRHYSSQNWPWRKDRIPQPISVMADIRQHWKWPS